jgi:hypothetical protein
VNQALHAAIFPAVFHESEMSTMRTLHRFSIFGILLAMALISIQPALAQQANGPTLDVRAGWDGYMDSGNFNPVTVIATNDGPDLRGEIRIQVDPLSGGSTLYTYPIDLPRGSRKQVRLYPANLSALVNKLTVTLYSTGQVIASKEEALDYIDQNSLLIGIWSDTPGALSDIGQVKPSGGLTARAMLDENDFPEEAQGWAALDVLVIYDADTGKLSPQQQAALRAWVRQGGRLILVGGASFTRTLSGIGDLSPLAATRTVNGSLDALSTAANKPFEQAASLEAPIAIGALSENAHVLVNSASGPLVVWQPSGNGRIDFLAADPALEPLTSWKNMGDLWRLILADGAARPGWAYGFNPSWGSAQQAIVDVPGVTLPSVLQLCAFLAIYVVLIGPLNYLVLARLKRRELAWITIPGLVLAFTLIAYFTGFQLRGSQVIVHRLGVIKVWQGEPQAQVETLVGLWSPRRSAYDVQIEPGFLARPMPVDLSGSLTTLSQAEISRSDSTQLRNVQVDIGSVRSFVVAGFSTQAPHLDGTLTMTPGASGVRITGDVLNNSPVDFDHVSLIFGGSAIRFADLPAGKILHINEMMLAEGRATAGGSSGLDPFPYNSYGYTTTSLQTDLAWSTDCYSASSDRRRCNLAASIINSETRGSEAYITGWADHVPLKMEVLNAETRTVDLGLYIFQMQTRIAASATPPTEISPGLMTWQLVDSSNTYAYNYTPYDLYLDPNTSVSFRYEPLGFLPVPDSNGLIVHVESYDLSLPMPSVEVWDFEQGRWERLQQAQWGNNLLHDAGQFIDAAGGVIIRLKTSSTYSISISRVDVTLFKEQP